MSAASIAVPSTAMLARVLAFTRTRYVNTIIGHEHSQAARLSTNMDLVLCTVRQAAHAGALVRRRHAVVAAHIGAALAVRIGETATIVARDARRLSGENLAAVI